MRGAGGIVVRGLTLRLIEPSTGFVDAIHSLSTRFGVANGIFIKITKETLSFSKLVLVLYGTLAGHVSLYILRTDFPHGTTFA